METFVDELQHLINKHSLENLSDTPDFILAQYIGDCFYAYNRALQRREKWYGREISGNACVITTLESDLDANSVCNN